MLLDERFGHIRLSMVASGFERKSLWSTILRDVLLRKSTFLMVRILSKLMLQSTNVVIDFCMFRSWVQLTLIVCRQNPNHFQVSFENGYGFALALITHSALTILWVTGMITRGLEFVPAHPALSDAFPYKPLLYHQWLDSSDIYIKMERVDQRVTI